MSNEKTLSDLEWPRVLGALGQRCVSEAGRRRAAALPLAETRDELLPWLAEAREAREALDRGEPLPLAGLRDVDGAAARLRLGAPLAPEELRDFASTLGAARALRRFLTGRHAAALSALGLACATDPTLDEVAREIDGSFEPDGALADHASPRLKELRGEARACRARIVVHLEELLQRHAGVLQDSFYTERDGRYVLPVRSDSHEKVHGIVHGTSASGSTLFVEPRGIIELGNRLKMLDGEIKREEDAIYARLSGLLHEKLPSVLGAIEALTVADLRAAGARLGADAGFLVIDAADVTREPVIELRQARHPILALGKGAVVASDLRMAPGRAVIISGPNAGGKTVALKTMGLAALMLRAGLPVACGPGSRLGFFDEVLTDVGDEQSLHRDLSTFSAHVTNLAHMLTRARPGVLILLDEIATGTDPREGEALAAAVLEALCTQGAAVATTTHYEGLKTLALGDARFENASVGFDLATMSPTFRVHFGVPGSSSALAVARRYGIPPATIARAEGFLSVDTREFEREVKKLHEERRSLEAAQAAAERARREVEAREKDLIAEQQRLRERGQHLLDQESEALLGAMRRARDDLRAVHGRVRSLNASPKSDDREAREAQRIIDEIAAKLSIGGEFDRAPALEEGPPVAPGELRRGLRVYVPRLRAEAEVVELLGDGLLRVAAGSLKMTLPARDVRGLVGEGKSTREPSRPAKAAAPLVEAPLQTRDNTCDLRGFRVDDAVRMAEQFLDRSYSEGRDVAFLLHGHGTGALREAVRSHLSQHSHVAQLRPGGNREGGEGVTVVWLR